MSKGTQELGETRTAMGWHVMNSLEKIINENKKLADRYFVIFYIKPFSACPEVIRNRIILSKVKPPKMLSTIVFEVDNIQDKLLFHWALPPDIPQDEIAYQQDDHVIPETAEAAKESGATILY